MDREFEQRLCRSQGASQNLTEVLDTGRLLFNTPPVA